MLRVLSQLIYIKKFDSVLKVRKMSFVSLKYPSDISSPIYKSLLEENDHFFFARCSGFILNLILIRSDTQSVYN